MLRQEEKEKEYDDDGNNELLYRNFVNALKSKVTKSNYTKLKLFS